MISRVAPGPPHLVRSKTRIPALAQVVIARERVVGTLARAAEGHRDPRGGRLGGLRQDDGGRPVPGLTARPARVAHAGRGRRQPRPVRDLPGRGPRRHRAVRVRADARRAWPPASPPPTAPRCWPRRSPRTRRWSSTTSTTSRTARRCWPCCGPLDGRGGARRAGGAGVAPVHPRRAEPLGADRRRRPDARGVARVHQRGGRRAAGGARRGRRAGRGDGLLRRVGGGHRVRRGPRARAPRRARRRRPLLRVPGRRGARADRRRTCGPRWSAAPSWRSWSRTAWPPCSTSPRPTPSTSRSAASTSRRRSSPRACATTRASASSF